MRIVIISDEFSQISQEFRGGSWERIQRPRDICTGNWWMIELLWQVKRESTFKAQVISKTKES